MILGLNNVNQMIKSSEVDSKFEEAAKQLLCRFRKFGNMLTTLLAHLYTFIYLWSHTVLALFYFLVKLAIKNGYCFYDACCGVPGSILFLEVVFMERIFFLRFWWYHSFYHSTNSKKLVGQIVKQIIPSNP